MRKGITRIVVLLAALVMLTSCALAETSMTEFTMKQFRYRIWSDWSLTEPDDHTHYHYKDNAQNAGAGYIFVQVQNLDLSGIDMNDPVMMEMVLNMLVSKLAEQLDTDFEGELATFGSVTGWRFSGPWPAQSCNIAGFVCCDNGDFFYMMFADDHSDLDTLTRLLTEELLPAVMIDK